MSSASALRMTGNARRSSSSRERAAVEPSAAGPAGSPAELSVDAFPIRDRLQTLRDRRDAFGFEHAEHRVEVLVDSAALVERRSQRVADDPLDLHAGKGALHLAHLGVDLVLLLLELALRRAARHVPARAV